MREGVPVCPISTLCLSICLSVYHVFCETYIKCSTFFLKIEAIWRKNNGRLQRFTRQRPVIKWLARDLLAHGILYQSCHLRCSCVVFSFCVDVVAGLQRLLSFPASKLVHFCQANLHMHKILLVQQYRH